VAKRTRWTADTNTIHATLQTSGNDFNSVSLRHRRWHVHHGERD